MTKYVDVALLQKKLDDGVIYADVRPLIASAIAFPAPVPDPLTLDVYDAGLLNDFGGGNIGWWLDSIRQHLNSAHEFYQEQVNNNAGAPVPEKTKAEMTKEVRSTICGSLYKCSFHDEMAAGIVTRILTWPRKEGG